MAPLVSLIVPVLADEGALDALLRQIPPDPALDIVVVDGGRSRGVGAVVSAHAGVRLIRSTRGRARQMNAGAAVARGEWLLFLHADSRLPGGWLHALRHDAAHAVGGWFRFALDDAAWQARVIEAGTRLRSRILRLPYGDQGIFVRRTVFDALGGYREIPIMEDVEFATRLPTAGPTVELRLPLVTSARRWRADGWFRRSARNVGLVSLYFAGVAPDRLARWYSR